eukprot:5541986-Pyramimonas_sp.AAC.1
MGSAQALSAYTVASNSSGGVLRLRTRRGLHPMATGGGQRCAGGCHHGAGRGRRSLPPNERRH